MAGNWLSTPPGWGVSLGSGNVPTGSTKRFVLKAPNGRRWETWGVDGHELREIAKSLHAAKRCCSGEPLDAPLPDLIPAHVRELAQRRCRDCHKVRAAKHFAGAHRSCRGCTVTACSARPGERSIRREQIKPCPACAEPRPVGAMAEVQGLGLACPSCAAEAKRAAEKASAEVVAVSASRPELQPLPLAAPAADDLDWFAARDRFEAAFGAPAGAASPIATSSPPTPAAQPQARPAPTAPALRLLQIRDFGRLRLLLELVAAGITGTKVLGEAMGAKPKGAARHACFYREAAAILGLLEPRGWALTELGARFLAASAGGEDERVVLRDAVAGAAPLGPLARAVLSVDVPELGAVVEEMAALLPKLSRATVERRVKDTLSWRGALGLAPLARAKRAPATRPSARTRIQLELWRPSTYDSPPGLRPAARSIPGLVEAHA